MINWRQGTRNPHNLYRNDRPAAFATEPLYAQELVAATARACAGPAALQALTELIHMSNLHLPDGSTVTLQVEVLRPRLLAIKAALE